MKNYKNIFFNHTILEYKKKYGKKKSLLRFSKEEVEKYNKFADIGDKHYLLKGRKWWYIDNTYYEIPSIRVNPTVAKASAAIVLLGGIASAIAIPLALNHDTKPITPPIVETECVVTFASNDTKATLPDSITVKGGTKIEQPTSINPGKSFLGWYNNDKKWDFDNDVVKTSITLEGKWDIEGTKKATVKFVVDQEENTVTYPYNSLVDKPINPTKDKQAFKGWKKDDGNMWDFNNDKVGESNITLIADFATEEETNTITYIDPTETGEEKILKEENVVKEEEYISQPDSNEITENKDDKIVEGYYKDEDLSTPYNFAEEEVKKNTTIYVKLNESGGDFKINGDHNIDLHGKGRTKFTVNKGNNKSVVWESSDEQILTIDNDGQITLKGIGGSVTITASKGEGENIHKVTYDCEVASFSKLDKKQLKEGKAVKANNNINGEVVIPTRYYVDDKIQWVTITTIPTGGLSELKDVETVKVPVPTKNIEQDALKGTLKDENSLELKDTTNKIKTSEGEKDPINDIGAITEALNKGEAVETVPNHLDWIDFKEVSENKKVVGYEMHAKNECVSEEGKATHDFGDLLVPLEYNNKPVLGFKYDTNHEYICEGAFEDCTIRSITFQDNNQIKSIGKEAFKGCITLNSINFSEKVKDVNNFKIESYAFNQTNALTTISLPNYLTEIESDAFNACPFESIKIPANVTKIGEAAFISCALKNVEFASNTKIETLEPNVFGNCRELQQFTIPASVKKLNSKGVNPENPEGPFYESGLTSLEFEDAYSKWAQQTENNPITIEANENKDKAVLGSKFSTGAYNTFTFNKVIEEEGERINEKYFTFAEIKESGVVTSYEVTAYDAKNLPILTEVRVPSHITRGGKTYPITKIGNAAFHNSGGKKGTDDIVTVILPDTITELGEKAFFQMKALSYINIPTSVTKIGKQCFQKNNNGNKQDNKNPLISADFGVENSTWRYGYNKKDKTDLTVTLYGTKIKTDAKKLNADIISSNSGNNGYGNNELVRIS